MYNKDRMNVYEKMAEKELFAGVQSGDPIAGEVFYRRMNIRLRYFVRNKLNVRDADEVDDIVNETMFRSYKYSDSYKPEFAVTTWIYTIAHNLVIDQHRKNVDHLNLDIEDILM